MKIKHYLTAVFLFIAAALFAQNDLYYSAINPANSTFVNDLKGRIRSPYTKVSYDLFDETNIKDFASFLISGSTRGLICVYTGHLYTYSGTFAWDVFSREHTWCHSWMPTSSSTSTNEYADQHHLFPVHQANANGRRSNHPFGIVTSATYTYLDGKLGTNTNGQTVYEPRNSQKGDAARALLYMCVKYDGISGYTWNFNWLNNIKLPSLSEAPQNLALLLQWHQQDPPDKWEVDRNNYIESKQSNRNPFIDHPEYVNYINFNDLSKLSPVYSAEPDNYLSNLATSVTSNSITLNWTDAAAGTQAPSGYLIQAFSKNDYFIPMDGVVYSDDTALDSTALVNISYSDVNTYTFNGLNNDKTYFFRVYSYNGDGALRNYKITGNPPSVYATTGAVVLSTEPSNHVTNINTSDISVSDIKLNWTDALPGTQSPSGYLVIANNNNSFTAPSDGTSYTDDANLLDGSAVLNINPGIQGYLFTGLSASTTYYFKVYSYNGSGSSRNYKTDGIIPSISASTSAPVFSDEPTNYVTGLSTSNVTSGSISLAWTDAVPGAVAPTGYLILANNTNLFNPPVDGTVYTDDPALSEGSAVLNLNYGTTQYSFSSLSPFTNYYFRVYSYNGSGSSRNYKTDGLVPSLTVLTLNGGSGGVALFDNFTRPNSSTIGSPSSTSALTWVKGNETATGAISILNNQLKMSSATAGREFLYVNLSALSGYPTLLNSAIMEMQWAINLKISRTDPSGFDNTNYGVAYILAMSSADFTTASGYAVVLGQSGTTDAIRLAYFTNGLNLNSKFTNIISGGDYGSEYLSIKVKYSSSTNQWTLFTESSLSSFPQSNPSLVTNQIGSAVNNTFTSLNLPYMGMLWNHNTASADNAVFSNVYITDPDNALPVSLSSFGSNRVDRNIILNWTTSQEINNSGFYLERINNEELIINNWKNVGFVKGNGTKNTPTSYSFEDRNLQTGKYMYRLKQVDYNGNFEYFMLENEVEISAPKRFNLSQNYPNPFNPETKISYDIASNTLVKLVIYDVMGREVKTLVKENQKAGMYDVKWNASGFASGVYFARLEAGSFTKSVKLLLMK